MTLGRNLDSFLLTLMVTTRCNLACKYCYVQDLKHGNDGLMTHEAAKASIGFVEKLLNEVKRVDFNIFGGEPLVAWDLTKEIIEMIEPLQQVHNERIKVALFTNMTLFDYQKLKYLKQKPWLGINFSLDGCKEAHDATRVFKDGSGSFDAVLSALELYKKHYPNRNNSNIVFKSVLSPDNIHYMYDSTKWFWDAGFKRISFSWAREEVWDNNTLDEVERQLKLVADFYIEKIDDGAWFDIFSIPIIDWQYDKTNRNFCSVGYGQLTVSPDGGLYPCQRFYTNSSGFRVGDVFNGIDKDNRWYNLFLKCSRKNQIGCMQCEDFINRENGQFKQTCNGGCLAAQWESGNIFLPIPSVCRILKANKKIAFYVYDKMRQNKKYQATLDPRKFGG